MQDIIQQICIWALPILFAITLHEAAHGYVAHKLGDHTAYLLGRVSANPLKHIDPLGTILIPLIMMLTTNFIFGWAKPVPVDGRNLKHPRRDFAWVAMAGPTSNFLMALFWAGVMKLGLYLIAHKVTLGTPMALMGKAGIMINLVLMVLNLIPLPPLDGSRVLSALLPPKLDILFNKITPFGFIILILLAVMGVLSKILLPPVQWLLSLIVMLFQLS
ncbi:site-2 protease family protein [Candidatus Berkiella aquae]|uniref:Peptidase family M50 n=1 Tax=Candidatus Berkiella aquae TaxID=295108 RepID=A0A0Q9YM39_9GAMM|nr:site-2 protease family protein [Candidatus Berkiella aquae]MCS5711366.1 site-2 protease family protein [Candidatus Berkiella aquae]